MKLYPKRLNGTTELKAERQKLRDKLAQIDPDGLLSLQIKEKKTKEPIESKSNAGDLLGTLFDTSGIIDIALKVIPLFSKGTKKDPTEKTGPNLLVKGAIEFVGGYLKWKAIQLSYRGLRKLLKARKVTRPGASS